MSHHHMGQPLPSYNPNTSYEDNSVPVIGVNKYAKDNRNKSVQPSSNVTAPISYATGAVTYDKKFYCKL